MLTIIYNMLCAVKFLKTANVIHRDLKPENIMIDNECHIIITDFGLARTMPQKLQIDPVNQRTRNNKLQLNQMHVSEEISYQKDVNQEAQIIRRSRKSRQYDRLKFEDQT